MLSAIVFARRTRCLIRMEHAMDISWEISLGNLLTAFSVLISASALAYGWSKDRQWRRAEYADRIRRAAGNIAAKLDRWPALALQSIDTIQPLFLELDCIDGDGPEPDQTHRLLKGLYEARAAASQRIADEQIESAYVDLYGYDPRIHMLFLTAVECIRSIDQRTFEELRALAQGTIVPRPSTADGASNSWDAFRRHIEQLSLDYERETDAIVEAFRAEMLKLIQASDAEVLARTVPLSKPAAVLPAIGEGERAASRNIPVRAR